MSLALFPTIPGIAYPISKTPVTSSRALVAASGVEYRAQNWQYPLWKFSLPIEFLRQFSSFTEYQTLVGFILAQAGMVSPFLYNDTSDNTVMQQQIGVGDGTTTKFPLVRAIGSYVEPIKYCSALNAVYVSGFQASGYSLTQSGYYGPDTVTFTAAPVSGVPITASFTFNFVCRFLSDTPEFMNFMNGRWSMKSLDFQSLK